LERRALLGMAGKNEGASCRAMLGAPGGRKASLKNAHSLGPTNRVAKKD
jgi:hypothetical protein